MATEEYRRLKIVTEPQKLVRPVKDREITPRLLKEHCRQHELYMTANLNDVLYLHYKGFSVIQSLDEYTGLKVLWLDNNQIKRIENLENQRKLRCLYLQSNKIETIESLECLQYLTTLNLASNRIEHIARQSLACLANLQTLNLAHNKLKAGQDVVELKYCLELSVLDLSHNELAGEAVLDVLSAMANLHVLSLKPNPIVSSTKDYRRHMLTVCKSLTFLDDRPVFKVELENVQAWMVGGDAEVKRVEADRRSQRESEIRAGCQNMIKMRDNNLLIRGVEASEASQLKAIEDRGRQLMESQISVVQSDLLARNLSIEAMQPITSQIDKTIQYLSDEKFVYQRTAVLESTDRSEENEKAISSSISAVDKPTEVKSSTMESNENFSESEQDSEVASDGVLDLDEGGQKLPKSGQNMASPTEPENNRPIKDEDSMMMSVCEDLKEKMNCDNSRAKLMQYLAQNEQTSQPSNRPDDEQASSIFGDVSICDIESMFEHERQTTSGRRTMRRDLIPVQKRAMIDIDHEMDVMMLNNQK